MKLLIVMVIGLMAAAGTAAAGEVFGTISAGGKPVGKGVKLEVVANQKTITAETDNYGSFRVFVPTKGKCSLKISYKEQALPFQISSYDHSVRYDFTIEESNGKFTLKRK
jgi:hypothetical protein